MTPPPITILQLIPELETGGAELSCIEVSEAIVKAGGRALVISEGGRMEQQLALVGGELIKLTAKSKNPFVIIANANRITRIIRSESIKLLHARSRAPAWSAWLASKRTGVPYLTTYHGAYNETSAIKKLYNSVMVRGSAVIANSQYTADLIQSRYQTPRDKVRIIYRGVDVARFDLANVAANRIEALRNSWGVKPHQRIVVNAARLTAWKGQATVIMAAKALQHAFPDCVFILGGDDQGRSGYRETLQRQIADSGLSAAVKLVGHIDDMPAAFAASHVAVVASVEPEAFGRAAAEAQAIGCPVISTNIGAPPETVIDQANTRTGWLVPPGDADALAAALSDALTMSQADRARISANAQAHVRAKFTTQRLQQQTLGVYDELLGTQLASAFATSYRDPD